MLAISSDHLHSGNAAHSSQGLVHSVRFRGCASMVSQEHQSSCNARRSPIMEQKARESGSFWGTIRRANALEVSPQTFVAAQPPDDLYTMATVIARWLIPNEAPTMGLYCATCQFTEEQYRMYTSDSLKTHLCGCRVQPHDIRALRARAYYKELFLQLSKEIGKSQSTVQKFCPSRLYQRSI
jgi:hypothetical protein